MVCLVCLVRFRRQVATAQANDSMHDPTITATAPNAAANGSSNGFKAGSGLLGGNGVGVTASSSDHAGLAVCYWSYSCGVWRLTYAFDS